MTIYGDKDAFKLYHPARGRAIPSGWSDGMINASLLVASEWIDGIYGSSFIGYKTDGFDQLREWPRTAARVLDAIPVRIFGTTEIPIRVLNATFEAAFRDLTTPGSLQVDYTPGKYMKVSIDGALAVDYKQFSSVDEVQTQIGIVDTWLWPLLECGSESSSLSGGVYRE